MEALYAALPSRNRELWALIRLTEAMAQPDRENAAVCSQERGALAYQVPATLFLHIGVTQTLLSNPMLRDFTFAGHDGRICMPLHDFG